MTAPSSAGVIRCIQGSHGNDANITAADIDLISGHLTATIADKLEIQKLGRRALEQNGATTFRMVNSLKSMVGHSLSAAGSIETVAAVLQLKYNFVHPNLNLEDPMPEILNIIGANNLPTAKVDKVINTVAKANFGFGDVNSCLIISKYKNN